MADLSPGLHAYMPNAGLSLYPPGPGRDVSRIHDLELKAQDVILTCGASGGLNIILKALLDPGDEVVILAPYFPEYLVYADNHGGVPGWWRRTSTFHPDLGPDRGPEPPHPGADPQFSQQPHGPHLPRRGLGRGLSTPEPPWGATAARSIWWPTSLTGSWFFTAPCSPASLRPIPTPCWSPPFPRTCPSPGSGWGMWR